jgi:hypothetical protein
MVLLLLVRSLYVLGQDAPVTLHSLSATLFDRILLMEQIPSVHSAIKPYDRQDVFEVTYHLADTLFPVLAVGDLRYLLNEQDEYYARYSADELRTLNPLLRKPAKSKRSLFKVFYTRPAHFFAVDEPDFFLRVNPILHFGLANETNGDHLLFINRRGIELRGGIDNSVFFTTNIIETQLRPPSHVQEFVQDYRALPDAGLFKDFNSRIFKGPGAYDYLSSSGSVGVRLLKHVGVQLAHGKNFIGDGYRSLFLSDFAKNYFYLKFNTRIWRFHYQNIFAELGAREKLPGNTLVPKKYMAAHYLSLKLSPRFTIGLFESVIFGRQDGQFELQYLNPIILYRSIEHHVGSPDNILLGLSASLELNPQIRLYGQFVIDEFKFDEFFSSRKWWGNKYGLQLGGLYINALGIKDLDLRIEYNRVRPFTYSHYDSIGSYAHFNQPLAHPAGANFTEVLFKVDYRPLPHLFVTGMLFSIRGADDTEGVYYGSNILRSNADRNAEFGIAHRQGIPARRMIASLTVGYLLKHNLFVEAQYFRRDFTSVNSTDNLLTQYFSLGLRWNYVQSQDVF